MAVDETTAAVDELVELCKTLDPPLVVSMDPTDINPGKGAWLAVEEIRTLNLAGDLELRCALYLVAPEQDPKRALGTLALMFKPLRTVLSPDGPVIAQGLVMPDSHTPLPALRVPVYLHTKASNPE